MGVFTTTTTHKVGDEIVVNLTHTKGQASAIAANGGPTFTIKVTSPVTILAPTKDGAQQSVPGFGRVISAGPVKGYEVLYTLDSVLELTEEVA